jgi:hypothetical protein
VLIDTGILALLENSKTNLESLISETSEHAEQIAKLAFSWSSGLNEFSLPNASPIWLQTPELDPFPNNRNFISVQSAVESLGWQHARFLPQQPEPVSIINTPAMLPASAWMQGSVPTFQTIGSGCWAGALGDGTIDCRMPTEFTPVLFPGSYFAVADTESTIVSPLVFLPYFYFLLLQKVSAYEDLCSLVVVAMATIILRQRSAHIPHAIAVCQRSFFTHHGAHPPDHQPRVTPGCFWKRCSSSQVTT